MKDERQEELCKCGHPRYVHVAEGGECGPLRKDFKTSLRLTWLSEKDRCECKKFELAEK